MNSSELVRNYFDRGARRFDAIYEERKPFWERWTDRWRRVVVERHRVVCNLAPLPGEWSVLDVGCGPGRFSVTLAGLGARVVGVDVAAGMIELAREQSRKRGLDARCEFQAVAFEEFRASERFDVVIATGYFDYLERPRRELEKMLSLCRGRLFASFPKRWELRVPLRRLRFELQGGFVRFYSRRELAQLLGETGVDPARTAILDLGRDWLVCVRLLGIDGAVLGATPGAGR